MACHLEIYELASETVTPVLSTTDLMEAPNWMLSGDGLIVNGGGALFSVTLTGEMSRIDTGDLAALNNDHGISPDGSRLVVSDNGPSGSIIYTLPACGGAPERVTDAPGAYWHGWSPDGETLAFCGKRAGAFDIYTIPVSGGAERRLTGPEEGHNDGPDYSPDGNWIWFNSDRTGHAQIWRVPAGGGRAVQVTDDDHVNWFPHPSPDGAWILYLAYPPGTCGHPADLDVGLRLMRPDGSGLVEVLRFNGGQGSINVPCWRPDGGAFAYVRYDGGER